jgi:hypothetical protein
MYRIQHQSVSLTDKPNRRQGTSIGSAWQLRELAKQEAGDFNSSQYSSVARLRKTLRRRYKEEIDLRQLPSGLRIAALASGKTPTKSSEPRLGGMKDEALLPQKQVIQQCRRQQSQHPGIAAAHERNGVVSHYRADSVDDTHKTLRFMFIIDLELCEDNFSTCSTLSYSMYSDGYSKYNDDSSWYSAALKE